MKKKSTKKVVAKKLTRKHRKNGHYLEFFGIGIGMFIGVLTILGYNAADKPYVLGTSIFLAHDGMESGGASSDNEHEGSQGTDESSENDNETPPPPQPLNNSGTERVHVPSDTLVDCVNPAGKHVRESFQVCEALHKASNKSKFSFTVLKNGKDQKMPPPARVAPSGTVKPEHELENNKGEMGSESGQRQRGRGPGGPEGNQQTHEFRHNNTVAKTAFPLHIDPNTNKLTVTTPSGTKEVSVLPDEAVQRILQMKMLSNVENEASSSADDGSDITSQTTLTEINNKPVFQIKGFSNKKVFGLFPASFAKTVYVSAEDGNVVKTDETFFSKALEAFSF
jgi:hypothetical protein